MSRDSVKIIHGALDEVDGQDIILRGVVDADSFRLLQIAEYQREVLPLSNIRSLVEAFETSSIPDIDLGMRGGNFTEKGGVFYLHDPVFIIDGLQRVTAAIERLQIDKPARLGAAIRFNTTEPWERARFKALNADRTKLSPNVLLRNMRHDFTIIEVLHTLTTDDKNSVMRDRVCWSQRMTRTHLISALSFLKSIAMLHSHVTTGGKSNSLEEVARANQKMSDDIGHSVFVHNVKMFFNFFDECWGIRNVAFKEGASYMRLTFMLVIASVFSRHVDFWREKKLFVEKDLQRKIKAFPLNDPNVKNLTAAGGKARNILYQMMLDHINSGKRTKRLTLRPEFIFTEVADADAAAEALAKAAAAGEALEEIEEAAEEETATT